MGKKGGVIIHQTKETLKQNYNKRQKKKKKNTHNDKMLNLTRGYNPCKHLHTEGRSNKIYKTNIDRPVRLIVIQS